jgi:hypothetical protein
MTPALPLRPARRGQPPPPPAAPGAVVADPRDLVARALAILAEETAAWNASPPSESPP